MIAILNGQPSAKVQYAPLTDYVLIEEMDDSHMVGNIALPDDTFVGPPRGRVVAVGPGRFEYGCRVPVDIEVGDEVYMFSDRPFTEVPLDGKKYKLIRAVYLGMKVKRS